MTDFQVFTSDAALVDSLSEAVINALARAIATKGTASLALSGGRSPIPFMHRLAELSQKIAGGTEPSLDWSKITVCLVDERWVAPDHQDSNHKLIQENLLDRLSSKPEFPSLCGQLEDFDGNLRLCNEIANELPPNIDVVILGMGMDGHTASLFPDAPEYDRLMSQETISPRYVGVSPTNAPHQRISMSYPWLCAAENLFIFIPGNEKQSFLETALSERNTGLPIVRILIDDQNTVEVFASVS